MGGTVTRRVGFGRNRFNEGAMCPHCKVSAKDYGFVPLLDVMIEQCRNCGYVWLSKDMPEPFRQVFAELLDEQGREKGWVRPPSLCRI